MDSPTHYELLCVTPEATADEIRSAYRRLIRVYHPDLTNAAGDAMTRRLNDAQRVLLDARLRGDYDRAMRARSGYHAGGARADNRASTGASPSGTRPSRPTAQSGSAEYERPRAEPRAPLPWSARRYTAWGFLSLVSIAAILTATIIVFALSYAGTAGFLGDPTMSNPRVIPPLVIALVWLAAVVRRANPFLVALLVIGAALWPLALVPVEPFGWLETSLPPVVLPLLTLAAVAVIGYRIATPRFSRLLKARPQPAASRPRQSGSRPTARPASPAFRS